jgi:hypothetical protein
MLMAASDRRRVVAGGSRERHRVAFGLARDFRKFIAEEVEKWAKVIRAANVKPK